NIGFEDDNISLNRERFERICDLIIEKELPVTWDTPNGIRADTLDESFLRKMKKSGCTGINLAPEVGDQDVLENIVGKKLDLESVEEVVQICKDIDLAVGCFFMVGLIGETKHNMQKTVEFACRLRELGAVTFCFIAQPYYGSAL
ncbi:MAG: radical SAM protein, partial [Desulfobacteraceae bacterium]|nr:radical SAM protein [Desulfobacteraceae bacterium]